MWGRNQSFQVNFSEGVAPPQILSSQLLLFQSNKGATIECNNILHFNLRNSTNGKKINKAIRMDTEMHSVMNFLFPVTHWKFSEYTSQQQTEVPWWRAILRAMCFYLIRIKESMKYLVKSYWKSSEKCLSPWYSGNVRRYCEFDRLTYASSVLLAKWLKVKRIRER